MPAKSLAQQRLFGLAYAIRKGLRKRSEANDSVLKIVASKMSTKQIEHSAKTKGLKEHLILNIK